MKEKSSNKRTTLWLCITAMFMALNVAMSSFGVPVPGGHMYMNDIVICTAAILLDPFAAFMVGGVGAFLGDMLFYPTPMFVSLVTHGLQAVVISAFSHYTMKKHPVSASGIGVAIGAVIMSSISRLLVFIGLPATYNNTITGVMLLVIVVIDALAQSRSIEMSRRKRLLSRTAENPEGGAKA